MDPDANLAEQIEIVKLAQHGAATLADFERLTDLVEALDQWIVGGGFLPERWREGRVVLNIDQPTREGRRR